jgi:hypothetical protein
VRFMLCFPFFLCFICVFNRCVGWLPYRANVPADGSGVRIHTRIGPLRPLRLCFTAFRRLCSTGYDVPLLFLLLRRRGLRDYKRHRGGFLHHTSHSVACRVCAAAHGRPFVRAGDQNHPWTAREE